MRHGQQIREVESGVYGHKDRASDAVVSDLASTPIFQSVKKATEANNGATATPSPGHPLRRDEPIIP